MFYYNNVSSNPALTYSTDINSCCGWCTSFAAFINRWHFYKYCPPGLGIKGKVHGVYLKVEDPALLSKYAWVAPEEIPHRLIGFLGSWHVIRIYLVFLKLWVKRKACRLSTANLTSLEETELYNLVIYPALISLLLATAFQDISSNLSIARAKAQARANKRGKQRIANSSNLSMPSHAIQAAFSEKFT
jgi:hypothetical protein